MEQRAPVAVTTATSAPTPTPTPTPLWTIITLTIPERAEKLAALMAEIERQITAANAHSLVDHLVLFSPPWVNSSSGTVNPGHSVGAKIRKCFLAAKGHYVSVVDDDDWVGPGYVGAILRALEAAHDVLDVLTFGVHTPPELLCWLRTNVTDNMEKVEDGYVRLANHLCVWRKELALSAPCLPRNYGWDKVWYTCLDLANSRLREVHIHEPLYEYRYTEGGTIAQGRPSIGASMKDGGRRIFCCRHRRSGRLLAGRECDDLYWEDGTRADFTGRKYQLELLGEVLFD